MLQQEKNWRTQDSVKLCGADHKNYWRRITTRACKETKGTLISWVSLLSASVSLPDPSSQSEAPITSLLRSKTWVSPPRLVCLKVFPLTYHCPPSHLTSILLLYPSLRSLQGLGRQGEMCSSLLENEEKMKSRQDPPKSIQIIIGKNNLMLVTKNKTVIYSQPAWSHTATQGGHSKPFTWELFAFLFAFSCFFPSAFNAHNATSSPSGPSASSKKPPESPQTNALCPFKFHSYSIYITCSRNNKICTLTWCPLLSRKKVPWA